MCQKNEGNNVRKQSELAEGGSLGINRCFSLVETNNNYNFPIVGNASSSQIYSGTNSSSEWKRTTTLGKNLEGIKKEVSTFLSQSLLRKNGKYPREMSAYVKFEEEKKKEREELKKQIEDEQGIELEQSNYIQPNDFLNQIIQQQQQFTSEDNNNSSIPMNKVDNLYNRLFHKTYSIVTDAPNRANSLNSINNNNNNGCHGSNPSSVVRSKDKNSSMFSSKIHATNQNHNSQTISFRSPIINAQFHSNNSQDRDVSDDENYNKSDSSTGILSGSFNMNEKNNIIKSNEKRLFQTQCSLQKQPAGVGGTGSNCSSSTFKYFRQKKVTRTSNSLKDSLDSLVDSQKNEVNLLAAPDKEEFGSVHNNDNTFQTRDKKITPSFAGCFDSSENEFILDNDTCGQMGEEKCSQNVRDQLFSQKPSNRASKGHVNDIIQTHQSTFPEITDCEIEDSGGAAIHGSSIRSFDNHTSSNFAIFSQSPCNKQTAIGSDKIQSFCKNPEKLGSNNHLLIVPHSSGAIQHKENAFYLDEDEDSYGSGELKPCVQLAKHQSWSNSHNNASVSRDNHVNLQGIKLKNSENVLFKSKQSKQYEELEQFRQTQQENKQREVEQQNSSKQQCQQQQQYEDLAEITIDASEFQERGKQTERSHDLSNYQFSAILTPAAKGKNSSKKIFEFDSPSLSKYSNESKKKIENVELLLIPTINNR